MYNSRHFTRFNITLFSPGRKIVLKSQDFVFNNSIIAPSCIIINAATLYCEC